MLGLQSCAQGLLDFIGHIRTRSQLFKDAKTLYKSFRVAQSGAILFWHPSITICLTNLNGHQQGSIRILLER